MTSINNLSSDDALSQGDLVPIYSNGQGTTRKATAAAFVAAIGDSYVTQAQAQANAATLTVSTFQNLVYPGVYAVNPTTRPNGSAMQDGDRAVILLGGVPTEYVRSAGVWITLVGTSPAALAASSGSSLVGFLQAGVGAIGRTVQDKLRSDVPISISKEFLPASFNPATDMADGYIAAAIAAAPVGSTLLLDYPGTLLVDTSRSRSVALSSAPSNLIAAAVLVNKAIDILGTPQCTIKTKPFSTAWSQMASGDFTSVFLVTASNATIRNVNIDANSNFHYEVDGSNFKWWEQGPTLKRPIDAVTVTPTSNAVANVTGVVVEGCVIDNALGGVSFRGNLADLNDANFLNRTKATGCVYKCEARFNTVMHSRGNSILFIYGASNCRSIGNRMIDNMYHAVRYYSTAVDCQSLYDYEIVRCDNVIARWNSTDLGYWRTDKSSDPTNYKVQRAGFCGGGQWNYISGVQNILDCTFSAVVGKFVAMASGHTTYYDDVSQYMGGINSVQLAPGTLIEDCETDGYVYGVNLFTDAPAAAQGNCIVRNNRFKYSRARGAAFQATVNLTVQGNEFIGSQLAVDGQHMRFNACPGAIVDGNKFRNGTNTGDRYGINFTGDCTGIKIGRHYFDANVPVAKQYSQDVGSTPLLPLPGLAVTVSTITSFLNGWAASSFQSGIGGTQTAYIPNSDGTVQLCLRLNAAAKTADQVFVLPSALAPAVTTGFMVIDLTAGGRYFGRILTSGAVEVYNVPTGTATILIGEVTYSTI